MAAEERMTNADFDDFVHQSCYIFKPTTNEDEGIDNRPRKKRKTLQVEVPNADTWPRLCSGLEPDRLASLREQNFTKLWDEAQARIDNSINYVDDNLFNNIVNFAQSGHNTEGRLKTALTVSNSDSSAQKYLMQRLKAQWSREPHNIAIEHHGSQAPNLQTALKNIIRTSIEAHSDHEQYSAFLSENKRMIPMSFDLELLQKYISDHGLEKVYVSISDVETFDLSILSELLSSLASWTDRIPFVLLLGIATTVDLFESRLSRATIRLLDPHVFEISSGRDRLYDVYAVAQHHEDSRIRLGPAVVNVLRELALDQSTTIETMIRMIKYCYMSHFFANPLSILCVESFSWDEANYSVLAEAIRNTSSFQAHCEDCLSQAGVEAKLVRQMLDNDRTVVEEAQRAASISLHSPEFQIIQTLQILCANLHPTPPLSAFALEHLLLTDPTSFLTTPTYTSLISTLRTTSVSTLGTIFAQLPSTIDIATDLDLDLSTLPDSSPLPSTILNSLFDSLSTQLHALSTYLTTPHFMHEAYTFDLAHPLSTTFTPRPRYAIERALSRPADYLGCDCCSDDNDHHHRGDANQEPGQISRLSRHEPTSLLYTLLEEAGREINVRDLWDAFRSRMDPSMATDVDSSSSGLKRRAMKVNGATDGYENVAENGDGDQEESEDGQQEVDGEEREDGNEDGRDEQEKLVLALFYRSLAEVKMLGLVKSANSKVKGVDVIAKTSWKGL